MSPHLEFKEKLNELDFSQDDYPYHDTSFDDIFPHWQPATLSPKKIKGERKNMSILFYMMRPIAR